MRVEVFRMGRLFYGNGEGNRQSYGGSKAIYFQI